MNGSVGYDVLPNKLDLEGGRLESTRTCIQRLIFSRTRRLLLGAYLVFLCLVLVVAGLPYAERHELYGFQWLNKSPTSGESTLVHARPGSSFPRHPQYIIFEPPSSAPDLLADRPLKPATKLPESCLESHLALGYPCANQRPTTFDVVWTWVNGSDHRLQEAMGDAAVRLHPEKEEKGKNVLIPTSTPNSKLYRDHDELRHSFRSVLQHFRPYIKQFHLFTSDFPFSVDEFTDFGPPEVPHYSNNDTDPVNTEVESNSNEDSGDDKSLLDSAQSIRNRTLRMGQLPSWLRTEEEGLWQDGAVKIEVTYQAQVFRPYAGTSFNSYSIESQLPYLPHVEQNFLYLNDDFFFTGDLQPSDFFTSAYGIVLRLDPTLIVAPVPAHSKVSPAGEWGPLGYSSWLLSERFGTRGRPYPIHAAKSFSMPLLDEAAHMWDAEFSATAAHKFRGMTPEDGGGAGDAYMSFLLTHFIVERWREALLWSWVVGRIGGDDDEWGQAEQNTAWEELGGDIEFDASRKVLVKMTQRKTVEDDRVSGALRASGQAFSDKTAYTFSSADGYPYSYVSRRGKMTWPRFSGDHIGQPLCTIAFDACIGAASSASEAFKMIAFEKPIQCGDCIIHALRSSSGVLGLSAFLPPRSRTFKPSISTSLWDQLLQLDIGGADDEDDPEEDDAEQETAPVPHLPLVKNWAEGNFTLKAVLEPYGAVNVRSWTMRLMERYRFVLGDTNIVFLMIESAGSAIAGLKRVTKDVSLLCLNDDVKNQHQMADKVLRDWQHRRWRQPAEWER